MIREFYEKCKRVLVVTQKPTNSEFWKIFKVSTIGIFIIGLLGFLILLIYESIFGV